MSLIDNRPGRFRCRRRRLLLVEDLEQNLSLINLLRLEISDSSCLLN